VLSNIINYVHPHIAIGMSVLHYFRKKFLFYLVVFISIVSVPTIERHKRRERYGLPRSEYLSMQTRVPNIIKYKCINHNTLNCIM